MSGRRALHLLVADAEPLGHAEPEVLQHDVGALDEAPEHVESVARLEVEEDRALPAVHVGVIAVHLPAVAGAFLARVVDLHDVGAELGQRAPGRRAREDLGEVDHAHALERGAQASGPAPAVPSHRRLVRPSAIASGRRRVIGSRGLPGATAPGVPIRRTASAGLTWRPGPGRSTLGDDAALRA